MKAVQIELSDKLAEQLEALVRAGWFASEAEAVRLALIEFLRHQQFDLLERFQRDDIAWALQQHEATG